MRIVKKPKFQRTDSNKYNFKSKWRRPRGIHNKIREKRQGNQGRPSIGYGAPVEMRYLNKQGFKLIRVFNVDDLKNIKAKEAGVIASGVGLKKKIDILNKAKEMNVKILNYKDVDVLVKGLQEKREERKKKKKAKIAKKEVKKKEETKEEKKQELKEEKAEVMKTEPEQKVIETADKTKDVKIKRKVPNE